MQGRRRINAKHIDLMLRVVVCSEENGCLFVIKASAPFNSDWVDGNNAQITFGVASGVEQVYFPIILQFNKNTKKSYYCNSFS